MAFWEESVTVEDDLAELLIPDEFFTLDVSWAVTKIFLCPVDDLPAKSRPVCRSGEASERHGCPTPVWIGESVDVRQSHPGLRKSG